VVDVVVDVEVVGTVVAVVDVVEEQVGSGVVRYWPVSELQASSVHGSRVTVPGDQAPPFLRSLSVMSGSSTRYEPNKAVRLPNVPESVSDGGSASPITLGRDAVKRIQKPLSSATRGIIGDSGASTPAAMVLLTSLSVSWPTTIPGERSMDEVAGFSPGRGDTVIHGAVSE
jgi:hypothetical protein